MQEVTIYSASNENSLPGSGPLVSVIIPTRNRIVNLKKALEAATKQTYNNYEVIIVDDASDDGTSDWVKTSYPRIHLIQLSKQCGAAKARNEALKTASGELIAFLDSDDEWLPEYLQFQVSALAHNPASIMSFCEIISVDADGSKNRIGYVRKEGYPTLVHRLLVETSFILAMSAVVIRANDLKRAGFLNERLRITHDRELYIRLLQSGGNITYIPRAIAIKHSHAGNISLNFANWAKDAMLLLDIFFLNEKNQGYKQIEGKARREILVALFDHLRSDKSDTASRLRISLMLFLDLVRFGKYIRRDVRNFFVRK